METRIPEHPSENLTSEEHIERLNTAIERAKEYAAEQAKAADRMIRQYPYQAVGIALGVGLLIGLLVGRK